MKLSGSLKMKTNSSLNLFLLAETIFLIKKSLKELILFWNTALFFNYLYSLKQ
jgi:hypothetical protein